MQNAIIKPNFYYILLMLLIILFFLPIVFAADRYGVTICNKNFDCNGVEDYVCPGKFSDDSGKLPGPAACIFDDYDCCVEYNKTFDVNNKLLMWDIPSAVDSCCGNALDEYSIAEKIVIPVTTDSTISSHACCAYPADCVEDGICYASLEIGKTCMTDALSCRDINDDGTLEVCLPDKQNTWEIIDTELECKSYIGSSCNFILGKCVCTTEVTVKVYGELKKGESNENKELKPLHKANVLIKSADNTFSKEEEIKNANNGALLKNIPASQKMIVQVSKKKYKTYISTLVFPIQDNTLIVNLELLDECQADCTKNDGICHQECNGARDPAPATGEPSQCSITSDLINKNNKYICENAKQGWSIEIGKKKGKNEDKSDKYLVEKVYCCQQAPKEEVVDKLSVKTGKVENLQTFSTLLILPDGKPGVMYVTLWDDNN